MESKDDGLLVTVQTAHHTDLAIASLVARPGSVQLRRWMTHGATPVLRVNAAGKLDWATASHLVKDPRSPAGRVSQPLIARLRAEISNPRDAGARWCSAMLLREFVPALG